MSSTGNAAEDKDTRPDKPETEGQVLRILENLIFDKIEKLKNIDGTWEFDACYNDGTSRNWYAISRTCKSAAVESANRIADDDSRDSNLSDYDCFCEESKEAAKALKCGGYTPPESDGYLTKNPDIQRIVNIKTCQLCQAVRVALCRALAQNHGNTLVGTFLLTGMVLPPMSNENRKWIISRLASFWVGLDTLGKVCELDCSSIRLRRIVLEFIGREVINLRGTNDRLAKESIQRAIVLKFICAQFAGDIHGLCWLTFFEWSSVGPGMTKGGSLGVNPWKIIAGHRHIIMIICRWPAIEGNSPRYVRELD